jgi:xanthine dehydrogenase small subunit
MITLRKCAGRRTIALEDLFLSYGRQDRQQGEFIESIAVPRPAPGDRYAVYKVSKRFDEDISTVLGAFRLRLAAGIVDEVVIAYGGMAGIPKRAKAVEAALLGRPWSRDTVEAAMESYDEDFQPLTDWRASAAYRMLVAKNLLLRFWGETTGAEPVRLKDREYA